MRGPPPEEEGAAEATCDELTAAPIPLHCLGGRGREFGSEGEPGKKEGVEERVLRFSFYFSLPYPDFIGNKLN